MRPFYLLLYMLFSVCAYSQIPLENLHTYINTEIHTIISTNASNIVMVGIREERPVLLKFDKTLQLISIDDLKIKLPFEVDRFFKADDGNLLALNQAEEEVTLAHIALTGKVLWKKTIAINADIRSVVSNEQKGYILGGIKDRNMFLCSVDKKGKVLWKQFYGGAGDDGVLSIIKFGSKGYLVGGYTDLFNSGETDMLVMNIAEDGKNKWEKAFGEPNLKEKLCLVTLAENGNILLVGQSGKGIWILEMQDNQEIKFEELLNDKNFTFSPQLLFNTLQNGFLIGVTVTADKKNIKKITSKELQFLLMYHQFVD